jgi:hypothetical protein
VRDVLKTLYGWEEVDKVEVEGGEEAGGLGGGRADVAME